MGQVRLFAGLAFASVVATLWLALDQQSLYYVVFGVTLVLSVLVVLAAERARKRRD